MADKRVVMAAVGALGLAVVAGALLWPRERDPCLGLVSAADVAGWRGLQVSPALEGPLGDQVCRVVFADARRPERAMLILALRRGDVPQTPGAERLSGEVQVIRPRQGRAVAVVPRAAGQWAEVTIEDEQQGDVTYWVDHVGSR